MTVKAIMNWLIMIVEFFNEFDWNGFTNGIAMKRLKQFHIIDVLKKQFTELK